MGLYSLLLVLVIRLAILSYTKFINKFVTIFLFNFFAIFVLDMKLKNIKPVIYFDFKIFDNEKFEKT